MQLAVIAEHHKGHGVRVKRQVFVKQAHVARPDEGHRQAAVEQERVGLAQGMNTQAR